MKCQAQIKVFVNNVLRARNAQILRKKHYSYYSFFILVFSLLKNTASTAAPVNITAECILNINPLNCILIL